MQDVVFYNEGCCSIRDFDHIDFPDCHNSGMIWMQKEINMSDIKEKAIKLAIDAMKPIPICSSPCYNISDNRSPEEKHEEEMRFCKDLNALVKTLLEIFPLYHIHETQVLS